MDTSDAQKVSERYAHLSDRFRSLWTFYQFLGGVFKHLGEGPLPYSYDFQSLYKRLQDLVPRMDLEYSPDQHRELERIDRELGKIHSQLSHIESEFPPSLLRRFFDHLKRQDEKILFALVKFYLLSDQLEQDAFDKLDILFTRLAEAPLEDGRVLPRGQSDLRTTFERLATFGNTPVVPTSEERPLVEAVREFRREISEISNFQELLGSQVFDRYRRLKQRLGRAFLHPSILVEIISCNIEAKNRFRNLYQDEEVRILEDTNRILEIERYLDRNPDLAHEELRSQIDVFRQSRVRYDSGRKEGNLKREDILQMRDAMYHVLESFERTGPTDGPTPPPITPPEPEPEPQQLHPPQIEELTPPDAFVPPMPVEPATRASDDAATSLADAAAPGGNDPKLSANQIFPPDPLLDAAIHKIVFALDLVIWDHSPEQVLQAKELHHLYLEPWEVEAYRLLSENRVGKGSARWDMLVFYLVAAALRIKIDEERNEIGRFADSDRSDLLTEALERSSQSLERARGIQRRFQWFIDDMLYRGEMSDLEQVYRSQFRFLKAYADLWLEHQASGGLTPL